MSAPQAHATPARVCAYSACGKPIDHLRGDAACCSAACRAAWSRLLPSEREAERWWSALSPEEREAARATIPRHAREGAEAMARDAHGDAMADEMARAAAALRAVERLGLAVGADVGSPEAIAALADDLAAMAGELEARRDAELRRRVG